MISTILYTIWNILFILGLVWAFLVIALVGILCWAVSSHERTMKTIEFMDKHTWVRKWSHYILGMNYDKHKR